MNNYRICEMLIAYYTVHIAVCVVEPLHFTHMVIAHAFCVPPSTVRITRYPVL